MSTIVHYECRNLDHLRTGSRRGNGGLVIHHGSVGYCDGLRVDGAHHWVATGGVPIEYLFESAADIEMRVELDEAKGIRRRGALRIGVKLSEDPDWPDGTHSDMTLLHAD